MPGSYSPLNIVDSYQLNAQCHLAYIESQEQADDNGYNNPYIRTEIVGSYRMYCDLPANKDIVGVEDITSGGPVLDLNAFGGQNTQWFVGPSGHHYFKIVLEYGGPNDIQNRHPEGSGERKIQIELANGQLMVFEIFVRGWKHLRAETGGLSSSGLSEFVPSFNGSDGTSYTSTTFPNGDLQYNPALRLDNILRNDANSAPSTPGPITLTDQSAAEIGRMVEWSGSTHNSTSINGFAKTTAGTGQNLQRTDNWSYAVHKEDMDEINKIGCANEFYHGRVYFKNAYGSGFSSLTNFQRSNFTSDLFQMQDPLISPAETRRTAIFVYETIDSDWRSVIGMNNGQPTGSTYLNHEQDNSTTPATGPRSYRRESGMADPASHPNPNGPYGPYNTNAGYVAATTGGFAGDFGLGTMRGGGWGSLIPSGGSITSTCNATHDGHYTAKATIANPNNGQPFPSEGYKAIWIGGGKGVDSINNNITVPGSQGYDDILSKYSSTTTFNYQRLVPPLISMTQVAGHWPPPPPGPCVVNPLILNAGNVSVTNITVNGANDGIATVNESALNGAGNTSPYTYIWTGPTGVFGGNSNSQSNLVPGNYSVTVTDANGCTDDYSFVITEPAAPPPCDFLYNVSVSYGCGNALLNFVADMNSGTPVADWVITVTDPNGNSLIPSTLTIPGGSGSIGLPGATGGTIINGTYNYTIEDANDPTCFVNGVIPGVNVVANTLNVTATSTNETSVGANDGTATVLISGGLAPYNFTWNNGQSLSTITNLSAGSYTVNVTDANGCSAQATVTVGAAVSKPLNAQPLEVCLNLDTGTFDFVDNNDYSPSGTTYPYRIAITIDHGNGVNVYPGSLAAPDIFSDSDLAAARTYDETINYGMNQSILIPMSGPNYISDIYKITTVWNFTGGNTVDHTTVSYVNAQGLKLFEDLTIKLKLNYSCAGDITSHDKTDYSISGIPYTLTRTHELFAPVASGLPSPAYTSGQNIINADLYEGDWTSSVTSYVVWNVPQLPVQGVVYDPLCIKKTFYKTKTKTVSCYIDPCVVHHHSKKIKNKYDAAICDRDIVKIKEYRFKYQRLIELLKIYIIGDLGDCAEDYEELWKMLEITDLDKITDPDCCGDKQINETMIADGKGTYNKTVDCTGGDSNNNITTGGGVVIWPDNPTGCPCVGEAVIWSESHQQQGIYVVGDYVNVIQNVLTPTPLGPSFENVYYCFQLWAAPATWDTVSNPLQNPFTDLGQYWEYLPCDGDGGQPIFGCTDSVAMNYDPTATIDDGSCVYPIDGCTDPTAMNYNPLANVDDGSCTYCVYGCMTIGSVNYDPTATCDDGSCIPCVYGCTEPTATNYDSLATCDDGSCIECLTVGCMDPLATNYDPLACIPDDTMCVYGNIQMGCTDPAAVNYNSNPTLVEDGSCVYAGCTDPLANNPTPAFIHPTTGQITLPTIDDGSCLYSSSSCTGELIIPDDTLEMELELLGYSNGVFGDNAILQEGDGTVTSTCDLEYLNVASKGISNAHGLHTFVSLLTLKISDNPITSIDVSGMTNLKNLFVDGTNLSTLDVSNNTALQRLKIGLGTSISSIDLTNNTALELLDASNGALTGTLDLSANINLTSITVQNNLGLNVLDLGSNINLNTLTLVATGIGASATIKVGSSARVTLANSLFTVGNGSISTGTTFIV
tara:strand:- start:10646 stop:15649 length:5004 start_codon:yes stop_codon:yes gene_type:complete